MIIGDRFDQSGMFSKAGRLSLEMYSMLQEKDNIFTKPKEEINNEKLQAAEKSSPKQSAALKPLSKSIHSQSPQTKRCTINQQPFYKTVGREQIQEIKQKTVLNNEKFGMYNPKYHLIYENSALYPNLEKEEIKKRARDFQEQNIHFTRRVFKKQPQLLQIQEEDQDQKYQQQQVPERNPSILLRQSVISQQLNLNQPPQGQGSQTQMSQSVLLTQSAANNNTINNSVTGQKVLNSSQSESSLLGINYDKPKRHIACPLAFHKQKPRKPLLSDTIPHEKRFEMLDIPTVSTRNHHLPKISFSTHGRSEQVFGSKAGGLDYDVNYNQIYSRSSLGVLDYSKSSKKQIDKHVNLMNDEDHYFAMNDSNLNLKKYGHPVKFKTMKGKFIHEQKLQEIFETQAKQKKNHKIIEEV